MTTAVDFVAGPIGRWLSDDHARLEHLLDQATKDPNQLDADIYAEFRKGLLRHIGMEEKILLPAAHRVRDGEPLPVAAQLRLDHAAIAALLVPTPTPTIVAALRAILARHNGLEEGAEGVYTRCERLAGNDAEALLDELRATPEEPVAPHDDGPRIMSATRRALSRAGYELADYENGRPGES
jgi:hemerythrin superfamily protein